MSDDLEVELLKEAEQWTLKLVKNPKNSYAYYKRTLIYGQLIEFNPEYELKQLADLKKALELEPDNQNFLDYETLLNRQEKFFEESSRRILDHIKKKIQENADS